MTTLEKLDKIFPNAKALRKKIASMPTFEDVVKGKFGTDTDYNNLVEKEIRKKYSLSEELSILRQKDTKPQEYQEYFSYCEECKAKAKKEVIK